MNTNNYQTVKMLALSIFMGFSVLNTQAQIYVNAAATGNNDGSSWSNAYTDLQPALDAATATTEIRVASGTYTPTEAPDGSTNNRNKAFHLNKDLLLKGGYNPDTNTQDATNPSILSGDFNDDDLITGSGSSLSITQNSENAYHVFITENLTTAAQIEGFLITGGNANGGSTSTISYSSQNYYKNTGGGMYHNTSSPSIVNSTFSGNAASYGGGMYSRSSSPSIVNTVFRGNKATYAGGMYSNVSSPSIVNTVFHGNKATNFSGGMYNASSSPSIVNSTFSGNAAGTGGGIRNSSSSATIYNTVFYGNGSDINNHNNSSVTGGGNFSENYTQTGFTALTADPFLDSTSPAGADGVWFTTDDGLQPGTTSPLIDAGDATKLPLDTTDLDGDGNTTEAIPFDITGATRVLNSLVDVGAYEFNSALSVKDIDSSGLDIYTTGATKILVINGVLHAKATANLYNLQGRLVASKVLNKLSPSNTLDVSSLSRGIYIVKIENTNHQVKTQKLFIH